MLMKRKNMDTIISICLSFFAIVLLSACSKKDHSDDKVYETTSYSTQSSEVTSPFSEQKEEVQMNFSQIKQGNYSSLLGDWEEVAVSYNRHDGNGDVWDTSKGGEIKISQDSIANGEITLTGSSMTYNDDSNTVNMWEDDKQQLNMDTSIGALALSIIFMPKNVSWESSVPPVPDTIDQSREHIFIRNSSNSYVQIFERKNNDSSKQTSEEQESEKITMNIKEIGNGHYQSINGIWKNDLGNTIEVDNDQITFSDVTNNSNPATISGLNLNIPNLNQEDGAPKLVPFHSDDNLVSSYQQNLVLSEGDGYLSLRSSTPGAIIYISFLPRDISADIQGGQTEQEKIIALATQNDPTFVGEEYVYYNVE